MIQIIDRSLRLTLAVLVMTCAGCATLGDDEKPGPVERTHYTLRPGPIKETRWPLPAEHEIFVDWHYSNGEIVSLRGFRGWDFNLDGRFDMLEVMSSAEGDVQTTAFDFDHDGNIDRTDQH